MLKKCIEMSLFLSNEKCEILMNGVVFGHHFISNGIKIDPSKVASIYDLPAPQKHKYVRSFLGNAS